MPTEHHAVRRPLEDRLPRDSRYGARSDRLGEIRECVEQCQRRVELPPGEADRLAALAQRRLDDDGRLTREGVARPAGQLEALIDGEGGDRRLNVGGVLDERRDTGGGHGARVY